MDGSDVYSPRRGRTHNIAARTGFGSMAILRLSAKGILHTPGFAYVVPDSDPASCTLQPIPDRLFPNAAPYP
jgi:hypothetical protein